MRKFGDDVDGHTIADGAKYNASDAYAGARIPINRVHWKINT